MKLAWPCSFMLVRNNSRAFLPISLGDRLGGIVEGVVDGVVVVVIVVGVTVDVCATISVHLMVLPFLYRKFINRYIAVHLDLHFSKDYKNLS